MALHLLSPCSGDLTHFGDRDQRQTGACSLLVKLSHPCASGRPPASYTVSMPIPVQDFQRRAFDLHKASLQRFSSPDRTRDVNMSLNREEGWGWRGWSREPLHISTGHSIVTRTQLSGNNNGSTDVPCVGVVNSSPRTAGKSMVKERGGEIRLRGDIR